MQKQLEGAGLWRAVQIELPMAMGNSAYNYCEQYTRFQRSINA